MRSSQLLECFAVVAGFVGGGQVCAASTTSSVPTEQLVFSVSLTLLRDYEHDIVRVLYENSGFHSLVSAGALCTLPVILLNTTGTLLPRRP